MSEAIKPCPALDALEAYIAEPIRRDEHHHAREVRHEVYKHVQAIRAAWNTRAPEPQGLSWMPWTDDGDKDGEWEILAWYPRYKHALRLERDFEGNCWGLSVKGGDPFKHAKPSHWARIAPPGATEPQGWRPQFDAISHTQEQLAIQFCAEIAGRQGERGTLPDPVRLLEMAELLYEAERGDAALAPSADKTEDRKDAERYRWLRSANFPLAFARTVLNNTPHGIDASIDAAMKESKHGN